MRLFEAIVQANHRALAGDKSAGIRPAEFADALPVVALTCIDPRLNPLMPEVLGIGEDQFIWLRNAGNIITGTLSSTMRSLALACVVKGGKEIAIIGHTDCLVGKTSTMTLTDRFKAIGIDRAHLPENITEYFGLFASERQNLIRAADFVRQSPLIGPQVPVHGLLVDIQSGRLEWIVNGYDVLNSVASRFTSTVKRSLEDTSEALGSPSEFKPGEMKFPEGKIGDTASAAQKWLTQVDVVQPHEADASRKLKMEVGSPPKIPMPPPLVARPGTQKSFKIKKGH